MGHDCGDFKWDEDCDWCNPGADLWDGVEGCEEELGIVTAPQPTNLLDAVEKKLDTIEKKEKAEEVGFEVGFSVEVDFKEEIKGSCTGYYTEHVNSIFLDAYEITLVENPMEIVIQVEDIKEMRIQPWKG